MDAQKFLTVKDFLNYYVAGVVWWLGLLMIVPDRFTVQALAWIRQPGAVGAVVSTILAVILPYAAGFCLQPVGGALTARLARCGRGHGRIRRWSERWPWMVTPLFDPVTWVVDGQAGDSARLRLPSSVVDRVEERARRRLRLDVTRSAVMFWYVRAYVEHKGGAAAALAARALDLANLTESLVVPVPLLMLLAVRRYIFLAHACWGLVALAGLAAPPVVCWMLPMRYQKLREYWVKSVYRAFAVLDAEENPAESSGR